MAREITASAGGTTNQRFASWTKVSLPYTIAVWAYPSEVSSFNGSTYPAAFSFSFDGGSDWTSSFFGGSGSWEHWHYQGGSWNQLDDTTSTIANRWYALVARINSGESDFDIHDPTASRTTNIPGSTTGHAMTNFNIVVCGNACSSGAYGSSFDGLWAEPAIWNGRLSDADVAAYQAGVSPRLIRPDILNWYEPQVSGTRADYIQGLSAATTGTIVDAAHPPGIIYPTSTYPGSPVSSGSVDAITAVGTDALTLAGAVPTLATDAKPAPGVDSLVLSGQQPAVSLGVGQFVAVGSDAVALTGQAVTPKADAKPLLGADAVALTGQAVTLDTDAVLAVGADAVALSGLSPAVSADANAGVGADALVFTGAAPVVVSGESLDAIVAVGADSVTLTGQQPVVVTEYDSDGVVLYNAAKAWMFDGTFDLDTDAVAAVLLGSGYTPAATHDEWSDVSGQEASGYTQLALAGKDVSSVGIYGTWDANDLSFGPTITTAAKYLVLVQGTAESLNGTDKLIGYAPIRSDLATVTVFNSALNVNWSANGIWRAA